MIKQIFVNLPVKNLDATVTFWKSLGFTFNAQFTDQNAACLELGENIFAMLIVPDFFTRFTKKTIADALVTTEVINAIAVDSREAVDSLTEKALAAGAQIVRPTDDYGWMYSRSFQDIDGHQWELLSMDESKAPVKPDTNA